MRLIKLDTTSSTNDFLKEMSGSQALENFTVVTAENQTRGKGQMGAKWHSEIGKNLIMSILVKDVLSGVEQIFILNASVALAVVSALETIEIPELYIKWPNDIMSGHKKIGGILIENTVKSGGGITSIVGLGLNVNQSDFTGLPKASSLSVIAGRVFDKENICEKIVKNIESNAHFIAEHADVLWQAYHARLFKKDVPMPFENNDGVRFMGIIKGVTPEGNLELMLENDTAKVFGIKEIQMLY